MALVLYCTNYTDQVQHNRIASNTKTLTPSSIILEKVFFNMLMNYSRYFGVLFRVGSIFVCMGSDSIMNLHHYFRRVLPTPEDSGLT